MIKVIQVSSDTNIGGAGKCLVTILKNYDRQQFNMRAVLPVGSLLKDEIAATGTQVIEAQGIADKSLSLSAISALREIFKAEKPDIVHAHGCMSARIAARQAGCKVIYTRHSVFEPSKKISKGIGKIINGAVNNYYADAIIAVAEAAKDNIVQTGVDESKITVILNGVDGLSDLSVSEKAQIKSRFSVAEETVVSIVARLEDIKGHMFFIDAAKEILDRGYRVKFFIAGTGSYENVLKARVAELGLEDSVIFTGFISDVDKLMAITDIQVNASYGTEATSLALLEGMSIGIPAVVSDFGGNPGVIHDGVNGLVVEKKNTKALAAGLEKLLSDGELYRKLSNGAREVFGREFTSKVMTHNTEKLYNKVGKE